MNVQCLAVTFDSDDYRNEILIDFFSIKIDDTLLAIPDPAITRRPGPANSASADLKQMAIERELRGEFGLQMELPSKAARKRKIADGQ